MILNYLGKPVGKLYPTNECGIEVTLWLKLADLKLSGIDWEKMITDIQYNDGFTLDDPTKVFSIEYGILSPGNNGVELKLRLVVG